MTEADGKRSIRPPRLVTMAVLAIVGFAFLPSLFRPPPAEAVGRLAADFSVPVVSPADAKPFVLADHRGKTVALELCASWLDLCEAELKTVNEVAKDLGRDAVVVVVDTSDDRHALGKWLEKHPSDVPVAFDEGDRVARALAIHNVPMLVVVAPSGKVASVSYGSMERKDMKKMIERGR